MWSSLSESDQLEAFNQLQMEEKRLRKDGILNNNVHQLLGYKVGVCTFLYIPERIKQVYSRHCSI